MTSQMIYDKEMIWQIINPQHILYFYENSYIYLRARPFNKDKI